MKNRANASCFKMVSSLVIFYFTGAFSTVFSNVLFHFSAKGSHHYYKDFRKPWFQVWGMFFAMFLLIFGTPIFNKCRKNIIIERTPVEGLIIFRKMAIPAIFNLISGILSSIACLYLAPSIWQMFRGSTIIFTAFTNRIFHHTPFDIPDVFGIFLTFLGLIFVASSSIITAYNGQTLNYGSSIQLELISFVLILLSQLFHALQTIIEEKHFHDTKALEYEFASYEGIWGIYYTSFIMMPIANILPESWGEPFFESSVDSLYMLFHSWQLFLLFIIYVISITLFNLSFIFVTEFSTRKERNICDALRPILVWVLSVIIYYSVPKINAGEPMSLFTLIEFVGFMLMFFGSCIYNRLIKINCFKKDGVAAVNSVLSMDIPLIDSYGM